MGEEVAPKEESVTGWFWLLILVVGFVALYLAFRKEFIRLRKAGMDWLQAIWSQTIASLTPVAQILIVLAGLVLVTFPVAYTIFEAGSQKTPLGEFVWKVFTQPAEAIPPLQWGGKIAETFSRRSVETDVPEVEVVPADPSDGESGAEAPAEGKATKIVVDLVAWRTLVAERFSIESEDQAPDVVPKWGDKPSDWFPLGATCQVSVVETRRFGGAFNDDCAYTCSVSEQETSSFVATCYVVKKVLSLPIGEEFTGTGWVPGAVAQVEVTTTPPPESSPTETQVPQPSEGPAPEPTATPVPQSQQPKVGDPCGSQYVVGEAHPDYPLICSSDCMGVWGSGVPVWRPASGGCR